jgi:hypothetical protein
VENRSGGREYICEKKRRVPLQAERLLEIVSAVWKLVERL